MPFDRHAKASTGFTLVETLVVVVLLGIVSAYIAPKAFNPDQLTLSAQARNLAAHLQYAQWMAVTTGKAVYFCPGADTKSYQILLDSCTGTSMNPPVLVTLQNNATLSGASFNFNSVGTPSSSTDSSVALSAGGTSVTVVIKAVTGLVII